MVGPDKADIPLIDNRRHAAPGRDIIAAAFRFCAVDRPG